MKLAAMTLGLVLAHLDASWHESERGEGVQNGPLRFIEVVPFVVDDEPEWQSLRSGGTCRSAPGQTRPIPGQ